MGKTLYLECNSGISGDMTVAALLDLGADQEVLAKALKSLPVDGFETKISRVMKSGIDACDFDVVLDAEHENHDHDMEYLHGHEHGDHEHSDHSEHEHGEHGHGDHHDHDGDHCHDDHHHDHDDQGHNAVCAASHDHGAQAHDVHDGHDHDHAHDAHEHHHDHAHHDHDHGSHDHAHHHPHAHRGMPEIRRIINGGDLTPGARSLALKIFEILAEAEAKAHNKPVDEVHFHEVGAVDSIVDIVAAAVCLDNLQIDRVIVPSLCEGTGTVRCQHGLLPIPVPAVANIMQMYQLPVQIMDVKGEFVTPTGAAIVAAIRTSGKLPKGFVVEKIGIGAGKREYERPSMLRAMLIKEGSEDRDVIWKLETNIDDCSGEGLGFCMERLFEAGARDVHYSPVFMKKNRPGWQLNVICAEEDIPKLEQIIFRETTTIGIRRMELERAVLRREEQTVQTPLGEVQVKVCLVDGQPRPYPEYESVAALCRRHRIPYQEGCRMALEAWKKASE